jgi:predicted ArsR family transcriptional regulator
MKLKEPIAIREALLNKHGWATITDIAVALDMSTNTISRALRGLPVRLVTVLALSRAMNVRATDIAEVVPE